MRKVVTINLDEEEMEVIKQYLATSMPSPSSMPSPFEREVRAVLRSKVMHLKAQDFKNQRGIEVGG